MCLKTVSPIRRSLLVAPLAAWLGGCGFQLRQAPSLSFKSIFIGFSEGSAIGNDLRRQLASVPGLEVVRDVRQAEVVLEPLQELRERIVVALGPAGQVREFQLRSRLRFRLRTPQGRELIPESEILLTRDVSFNEAAVLARETEQELLFRDMQNDIVQQLMRRLAAVPPL
jgi:LPS-assembly lipoprotein